MWRSRLSHFCFFSFHGAPTELPLNAPVPVDAGEQSAVIHATVGDLPVHACALSRTNGVPVHTRPLYTLGIVRGHASWIRLSASE